MFRFNHPKEAAKLREKRKVRLNEYLGNLNLFTILYLKYLYLDCFSFFFFALFHIKIVHVCQVGIIICM